MLMCPIFVLMFCVAFASQPVFEFDLDLSKPATERWTGAVPMVVDAMGWDYSFGPVFAFYAPTFDVLPQDTASTLEGILKESQPEMWEELCGLARDFTSVGHPEVNTTFLSMWAFMYELAHVTALNSSSLLLPFVPTGKERSDCSGNLVLPHDPTAPILHGRNLDLTPFELRNLTMKVRAVNKTSNASQVALFEMVGCLWFTTTELTSSRQSALTLSGDWKDEAGTLSYSDVMRRIERMRMPLMRIFRFAQERQMSLDDVMSWATDLVTPAPFYLIASGPGRRGVTLSKAFEINSSDTRQRWLNDSTPYWFTVQTNKDWWVPGPDPTDNCSSSVRSAVAQNFLHSIGRDLGATRLGLWMTMNQFPVHNGATTFTAILSITEPIFAFRHEMVWGYPIVPWFPPPDSDCSSTGSL